MRLCRNYQQQNYDELLINTDEIPFAIYAKNLERFVLLNGNIISYTHRMHFVVSQRIFFHSLLSIVLENANKNAHCFEKKRVRKRARVIITFILCEGKNIEIVFVPLINFYSSPIQYRSKCFSSSF